MTISQYCVYITDTGLTVKQPTEINGGVWPAALITSPFVYKHNNISYDLNQAGVYKFSVPCQNTTNMIIHDGNVQTLLKSLTYFIAPGMTDEAKTNSQLNSKAYTSRINILCSKSVNWVRSYLAPLNIPSRIVRCLRSNTPNNFYDGHVMLEVFYNNAWHLFDPQLGFAFSDDWLAVKDVFPVSNTEIFKQVHKYKVLNAPEPMTNNVYHHASTIDMFLADDLMLKEFQKGIMQIPGIDHTDGLTYFYLPEGTESRQSWLLALSSSYRVVSQSTWLSMFY